MDDPLVVLLEVVDVVEELGEDEMLSRAVVVAAEEDVVDVAEVVLVGAELLVVDEGELNAVIVNRL